MPVELHVKPPSVEFSQSIIEPTKPDRTKVSSFANSQTVLSELITPPTEFGVTVMVAGTEVVTEHGLLITLARYIVVVVRFV